MKTLEQFKKCTWFSEMSKSNDLDGLSNFSGPTNDDWCHYVVVVGRNRDSNILGNSNFESAFEMLGGKETKDVQIVRHGHWACGWIELLMVNPKNKKRIERAYEIYKSLIEYPVLDEGDFSERECEAYQEYAEYSKKQLAEGLAEHFGVKMSKELVNIAFNLQVENQCRYGEDSCVNIYPFREPEHRDVKELANTIKDLVHNYSENIVFRRLQKAVDEKLVKTNATGRGVK
jgi:hypothetical protein